MPSDYNGANEPMIPTWPDLELPTKCGLINCEYVYDIECEGRISHQKADSPHVLLAQGALAIFTICYTHPLASRNQNNICYATRE